MGFLELKAKKDKFASDQENLRKEIKEQTEELEEAKKQANKAALDGDVNLYMSIKEQIKTIEAEAEVKQVQLGAMTGKGVSDAEIKASWMEYAGKHNKELKKALDKAKEKKTEFIEVYRELLIVQNEGLKERKKYLAMLGLDETNFERYGEVCPMDLIPMANVFPTCDNMYAVVGWKGRNVTGEQGLYMTHNPKSNAMTVISAVEPVDEKSI